MDAARITLDSDSVDRVLCESGFMLMPDPAAALRESRRVLRTGGRLAFSVWGPAERNPWDTIADDLLVDLGHLPPPRRDTLGTRMAYEQYTRAVLHEAGFGPVHSAEVAVQFSFTDLDEWQRWFIDTNSTGHAIRALSVEEHDTFLTRLASAFAPYRTARGYQLPGVALCAAAT